jgi:type III restriction enzyme
LELILERELDHQQKAVDALIAALDGIAVRKPLLAYENPTFDCGDVCLAQNLAHIQSGIRADYRGCRDDGPYLNLDVKMETGTGKTYVYTHAIYELHKRFGFNKFIIAVPSLPIKAGTAQFIGDSYVQHHFSDACGYNCEIELGVLESPKKKKKGFLAMPSAVRDFVSGSCQNTNRIYVLLVNMQLLTNGNMLTRSDYDYVVEGFYRPFDALRATRPIVMIDEPHRFSRDQSAYQAIVNELGPQMIIRFGATFPEVTIGRGRNKTVYKDFNNLVYELNACDSFNLNLIKGVAKEHFEPLSRRQEKVKLLSVEARQTATFQFKRQGEATRTYTLTPGEPLSIISSELEGITISAVGRNYVELTNGQTKFQGEEFNTDIFSSSYQEQMLKLAIQRHFETERQNFTGRQFKIKTLALFFIDDISSYRENDDEKSPYLKEMFERLLREEINAMLSQLTDVEQ